jgi:hypothetical protein
MQFTTTPGTTTTTTTTNTMHEAIKDALTFLDEYPEEKPTTSARIYQAKENSVLKARQRQRARNGATVQHGGQNKVLSDAQITALYKYIEDMYLSGLGATRDMLYNAIVLLKAQENPPKAPPSKSWFYKFLKGHPELFQTTKIKPIEISRISAQDIDDVEGWFNNWIRFCKEKEIQPSDILNFDETGFRVGVASGEEIIVPYYVKEVM